MNSSFEDLHVIVTGGAGGLGTAVVQQLLDLGAKVSVPVRSEALSGHPGFFENERVYVATGIDLANESSTRSFYGDAISKFGGLWASLHLAGGFAMGKIANMGLDEFMQQIRINTVTCYNCCRAAIAEIRQNGYGGGRIVNVAARPALDPRLGAGMSAYTASKAAVAALTQALASELSGERILVNAVAPSAIDTPANRKAMPHADFTKWVRPGEIAHQILYLASRENTASTGEVIPVFRG